jgi:hypothetical protein
MNVSGWIWLVATIGIEAGEEEEEETEREEVVTVFIF